MAYIVTNTQKICFFYEQSGEATPFAEVSNLRQADFCLSAEAACDLHQQVEFFCTGSQEASVFEVIPSTSNAGERDTRTSRGECYSPNAGERERDRRFAAVEFYFARRDLSSY